MGFRYRKSINLGGGFKINLSKSGLGYSWGVKGFRLTKTAKGTTRTTASIPGTGLAYISETGKKARIKLSKAQLPRQSNRRKLSTIIILTHNLLKIIQQIQ